MVMCSPILCRRPVFELSFDPPQRALWNQMHMCVSRHAQSAVALRFDVHQPERADAELPLAGSRCEARESAVLKPFAASPMASPLCSRRFILPS